MTLNGTSLGILWKPPFRVEVSCAIKPGKNLLEIKVTNLWPNRLIGDEKLHPDPSLEYVGGKTSRSLVPVKSIPAWVKTGGKSPVGRTTFAVVKFHDGDDPLLPSGLLGPVTMQTATEIEIKP